MRIALYARVSTTDQTCEQQLHALREYCTAREWPIVAEFVDQGISGAKTSRPALNRLIAGARKRAFDCVLVWKLDRLGRSLVHTIQTIQEFDSLGIRFIAITQGIDTDASNPMSRLLMHLLAAFAEFEREIISERVRAGLAGAKRRGKKLGRRFSVIDRSKVLAMHDAGMSLAQIVGELGTSRSTIARLIRRAANT